MRNFVYLFSLFVGLLALLSPLFSVEASTVYKSTLCSDLPLDPILRDGRRPLAQFFEDTSLPVEQRDCWVYEDITGENKIIAPFNWGETPDDFNITYVKSTFLAMRKTRDFYKSFAQAKDEYFIIIFETRPALAQSVAHELAHCLIMENLPDMGPANYDLTADAWWDESTAEWLSSLVYPESDIEVAYATLFDLDGLSFMQPYQGFLIFSHYAFQNSIPQAWALAKNMNAYATRGEQLEYFRAKDLAPFFLDFYMEHYQAKTLNLPASTYPREADVPFHPQSPLEIPEDESIYSFDLMALNSARANLFEVKVPKGYEIRLKPLTDAKDIALGFSEDLSHWVPLDKFVSVTSTCEEENSFNLMAVHLYEETLPRLTVEYKLTKKETCHCNLEEPRIDKCLVGSWSLDFEKVEALIRSRAQGQPVRIDDVKGNEVLVFDDQARSSINHLWSILGTSTHTANSNDTVEMTWQGSSTARYSTAAGGILCGQQLTHQSTGVLNYTTNGQTFSFPMNSSTGPIAPIEEGDVTYECTENQLIMVNRHDGDQFTFFYNRL